MRGLSRLTWLCVLLGLGLPALAAKPASSKPAVQAVSTTIKALDKARLAYQRDLASVLAPQVEAMPLLAAALLSRPLLNPPESLTFHTLITRAAAASDAGPAVTWARLADCAPAPGNCPNPAALAKLQEQAADNAAVWLLKLGVDTRNLDPQAAREDLARAAAAKIYDDYTGASLQALASNVGMLPPPPATLDNAHTAGAAGMQAVLVFGLGGAQVRPALPISATLCEKAGDDTGIQADCRKLGKLLEWGSSPLARSLGLHLREVLGTDATDQAQARAARRDLVWQVQQFAQLSARVPDDKALAQHLLALARSGGTEMSLLLAALRDNHLSTEAPIDWKPAPQP